MVMTRVFQRARALGRNMIRSGHTHLYLASDNQNWVLYWETFYLQRELRACYGITSYPLESLLMLRNQLLHFVDRGRYLLAEHERVHPSNKVIVNWYHGDADDPNTAMQKMFAALLEAMPKIEKVVTSCTPSRQSLIDVGVPPEKIIVLPIGIDLATFMPPETGARERIRKELGIPADAVCLGSFQKDGIGWGDGNQPKLVKGPDVFVDTVAELASEYTNLWVLLTGPARGYVKAGLERLGIPYVHRVLDNYPDIVPFYYALDLYLITSRAEGGPKAFLESWATGVPVVSTRMGMPADLIRHGQNGMLAETQNPASLANCVRQVFDDPQVAARLRSGGLSDVVQCDWANVARSYYERLYSKLLPVKR